jgi:hypothetical protein
MKSKPMTARQLLDRLIALRDAHVEFDDLPVILRVYSPKATDGGIAELYKATVVRGSLRRMDVEMLILDGMSDEETLAFFPDREVLDDRHNKTEH